MTHLLDSTTSRPGLQAERSERYVAAARAALLWERVWPALWPATGIVGFYIAAALFGAFAIIPHWAQPLILFSTFAGIGYALYLGLKDVRLPRWEDAARRVERDSTLSHRPITESHDRLAAGAGDPWAEELWRAHLKRRLAGLGRLRLSLPASGLGARDPHALRFIVLLLLAAGLLFAGSDWNRRLAQAFAPDDGANALPANLDAWITPPAYTGEAPVYLQRGGNGIVAVPAGSELVLRVHDTSQRPQLSLDPEPRGATPDFTGTSDAYGASYRLTADTDVRVRETGRLIGNWRIKTIADQPPVIAFAEPPARTERDATKIAFTAGDDYGVVSARALIRPVRASHKAQGTLAIDLPLASAAKTVTQTVYRDLTESPFAGLDVDIVLEAKDGAGQTGTSKPARFRLPARIFANPLARALIEQRQNLAIAEPRARQRAALTLDALTLAPDHFYANQGGVYLALRAAYWGLTTAHHPDDIARVQDLLWQTANGLEAGGLLDAAERLRQLQQLISQALAQGAPQNVIDALLEKYREALERYLQALAKNAQPSNGPPQANAKAIKPEDLEALLKAIQQMAQTGARAKAQELMAMLQSLIENMHVGAGSGQGAPGGKALSGAIQGLGDIIGRQRQLLDKSFRQGQGAGDPKDGGGKGLAQQQQKLHQDLDKITKGLDGQMSPPKSLGDAGRAMNEAQNELGTNQFDGAGAAQKSALDALRDTARALAQELMKRSGQGNGKQEGEGNEDPLGREEGAGSGGAGGNVKLPDQSELRRARSILEELRKRAAQPGRSKEELDYIDRLLKQF